MKIEEVRTDWLRIPLSRPISDSTHVLRCIDLILVGIRAGEFVGSSYMLSFDYAPGLLKGMIDQELQRHTLGQPADAVRTIHRQNLAATEYIGQEGLATWGIAAIDVALWDLLARRLGVPAAVLFGIDSSAVSVYGSGGWLSYTDEQLADEVTHYVARRFAGVKMKIGGDGEILLAEMGNCNQPPAAGMSAGQTDEAPPYLRQFVSNVVRWGQESIRNGKDRENK
jgi:L-alanine-DL-glutamate epimerase-like enolase superfamily enzyme